MDDMDTLPLDIPDMPATMDEMMVGEHLDQIALCIFPATCFRPSSQSNQFCPGDLNPTTILALSLMM